MGSFHILGFLISIAVYLIIVSFFDFDYHYLAMIKPLHLLNLGIYTLFSVGIWLLGKTTTVTNILFASIPSFAVFLFWTGGVIIYGDASPQKASDFMLMALPYGISCVLLLIIVSISRKLKRDSKE